MLTLQAILAVLAALAPAIPQIVSMVQEKRNEHKQASDAIIERDITVLHDALTGVPPK